MKNLFVLLFFSAFVNCFSTTWYVSPDGEYKYCSEISNLVSDGDTVYIKSGLYENDRQVIWRANDLTILGYDINEGLPELRAGETILSDNSNGKGIFVIQGNNTFVRNIRFTNSKVVDHNGAGIRSEGKNLIVRDCIFEGNENGILQGGYIDDCKILIEFCEFYGNGNHDNPGYQHNIYINHIDTLIFRFNVTEDAVAEGHELKSRADNNFIMYNIISNKNSGDSRNIDLPNGGTTILLGNVIDQGENSVNSGIIGFGLEGLINPGPHNLWICSNTIVNKKDRGNFVNVADIDTLFMYNNICVGAKTNGFITGNPAMIDTGYNYISDDIYSVGFGGIELSNYLINFDSPVVDMGINLEKVVKGYSLLPEYYFFYRFGFGEYVAESRGISNTYIDIGAYEYLGMNVEDGLSDEKNFSIYPNPVRDILRIKFEESSITVIDDISIYDMHGKFIRTVKQKKEIDVSDLGAGIYFLRYDQYQSIFIKE